MAIRPDGSQARDIPVAGVTNLAVSEDGSRLAASIPSAHEIAVVDTGTDEVMTYPAQGCPAALAIVGSKVWFADTCDGGFTRLHDLDLATGTGGSEFGYPVGYLHDPGIYAVPGTHQVLVFGTGGADLSVFDADTGQLISQAQASASATRRPVVFGPDPDTVLLGMQEYHLPDLTALGTIQFSDSARQLLTADDNYLVAASNEGGFEVFDRGTTDLLNTVQFGGDQNRVVVRVALAQGNLLAFAYVDGAMQMYEEPTPGIPAPTLTAEVEQPVVIEHQTTLSGTLSEAGSPVSGSQVTVRRQFSRDVLASTVTDATGAWEVPYTFDTSGGEYLTVTAAGAGSHKAAVTQLSFYVQKLMPAFALQGPDSVTPGSSIDVHGVLSADGVALGGRDLTWNATCPSDYTTLLPHGSLTTQPDGTFTLSYDPGRCAEPQLEVSYAGDDRVYDGFETVSTHVSWHIAHVSLSLPALAYVGDDVHATAFATVDGEHVGGLPVHVEVRVPGEPYQEFVGTTRADGSMPFTFDTPTHGSYGITVWVADTDDILGDTVDTTMNVAQVTSDLSVEISSTEVTLGGSFTFTGQLTHADGASAVGSTIRIAVMDASGSTTLRTLTTTTAADGSFQLTDTPTSPGQLAYDVSYDGDPPRYAAVRGTYSAFVVVDKITPHISLETDRPSYAAGDQATLHVDLTDSTSRQVIVTATREGEQPQVLFTGTVPDDGLTLRRTMARTETITATTPADDTHSSADASVTTPVRLVMATYPRRPLAWRGQTAVFASDDDPVFRGRQAKPRRLDIQVVFQVQRHTDTGWRSVVTSKPEGFDPDGRTGWTFVHHHRAGVTYRVRTRFAGDPGNATSTSNWLHFRFRRS
ncbi:MAG: hypothetical protein J2P22_00420 [Nocardioides sp.]|nr:hypothetical protein [Nocardioides sp.]